MFDAMLSENGSARWITVGPFLDYQDGVTPVANLSGSLSPFISKDGGFAAQMNDSTPAQAYDRDGRYRVLLGQLDQDTAGSLKLWVANSGVHLDVEHNYVVLHQNTYLNFIEGQDTMLVDVQKISGDAAAAANLEAMYDGTGYVNANAPATQAQATGLSGVAPAALRDINLDHLMAVAVTGTDVVDDTVVAMLVSSSATADWDTFDNTTDALQAIRDRGDAAWTTGGAGGLTAADVLAQAQLAILNSGVLGPVSAPTNFDLFSIDGSGRVDVGSWLGTAVTVSGGLPNTNVAGWRETNPTVGGTSGLPVVDAQAISDDTATADSVQSNIGNLDAAISSLNDLAASDVLAQAQLAIANSGVLNTSVPTNWSSFSIDGSGRVDVGSWLGTAVTTSGGLPNTNVAGWLQTAPTVGATSGLPVVDAQAISDNTAAADSVQSNIGNLDQAISSLNDLSAAQVNTEVDSAIETYGLQYLVSAAVAGANVTDDSIVAQLVSSSATADWDTFDNTTDALQAIRDRGDAAWTTGGAGVTAADVLAQSQLAIANSGVLNTSVPTNWSSFSIDGSGRVDVGSWLGTAVTVSGGLPNTNVAGWRAVSPTVGSTSNLPVVDAQAISDSTGAADSVQANIGNLDAAVSSVPTAAENAAALLDLTDGVETGVTPRQALRAMAAVLAGESSGVSTGSPDYKAINNNGTTRVSGTASDGDRSSVTLNL